MKNIITDGTVIRAYFDNLMLPKKVTYAAELDGNIKYLADYPADMNTLEEIKELGDGVLHECRSEYYDEYYFAVKNRDFNIPFS